MIDTWTPPSRSFARAAAIPPHTRLHVTAPRALPVTAPLPLAVTLRQAGSDANGPPQWLNCVLDVRVHRTVNGSTAAEDSVTLKVVRGFGFVILQSFLSAVSLERDRASDADVVTEISLVGLPPHVAVTPASDLAVTHAAALTDSAESIVRDGARCLSYLLVEMCLLYVKVEKFATDCLIRTAGPATRDHDYDNTGCPRAAVLRIEPGTVVAGRWCFASVKGVELRQRGAARRCRRSSRHRMILPRSHASEARMPAYFSFCCHRFSPFLIKALLSLMFLLCGGMADHALR